MAFTAEYCSELMYSITHTAKDRPEIIDCAKLVEVAEALKGIIVDF
jgi:aminopeptidase YwaD